jgi:hypothetical protein
MEVSRTIGPDNLGYTTLTKITIEMTPEEAYRLLQELPPINDERYTVADSLTMYLKQQLTGVEWHK